MFVDLRRERKYLINKIKNMKKIIGCLFLLFFGSYASYAQAPEPTIAKVMYNFEHVIDTNHRDMPQKESMGLFLGKNASLYASMDNLAQVLELEKSIRQQMAEQGGKLTSINIKKNGRLTSEQIFYFGEKNQLFTSKRLVTNYLVEDPSYKIDWNITQDTMNIEGMTCYKATARFRGRNWTAWFNPELPFQAGPWKLHGLPGLIVDARDDRNEVIFSFAGFETVKPEDAPKQKKDVASGTNTVFTMPKPFNEFEIKLPDNAVRTTAKEFDKLKAAMEKDPQGFFETQMAGSGEKVLVVTGGRATGKSGPVVKLNNPIELSDK